MTEPFATRTADDDTICIIIFFEQDFNRNMSILIVGSGFALRAFLQMLSQESESFLFNPQGNELMPMLVLTVRDWLGFHDFDSRIVFIGHQCAGNKACRLSQVRHSVGFLCSVDCCENNLLPLADREQVYKYHKVNPG